MPKFRNGNSNPGSLDSESGILPLSYRAPEKLGGYYQRMHRPRLEHQSKSGRGQSERRQRIVADVSSAYVPVDYFRYSFTTIHIN